MFRVIVADVLPDSALESFRVDDFQVDLRKGISAKELAEVLGEYDGLVVRSRTQVTRETLHRADRLKVIGRAGAGVDNIDVAEATRRGIVVMNAPGGNTIAAAEHTLAMLMSTLRNIPQACRLMKEQRWDKKAFTGRELRDKTVGIIGLGKIGQEVAKRLSAFDVKLLGYDPIISSNIAERLDVALVSLTELLSKSDIITIHAPRIPATTDLINSDTISKCKDGVVIVNCARGGIVNEIDLLDALNTGKVAAAALDVFAAEPPEDWSLISHPRVVATPHLGASTEEALVKVAGQILHQMRTFLLTGEARHAVNVVSIDEQLKPIIAPYLELGHRLGTVFSQLKQARLKELVIRLCGDVTSLPTEPIAAHLVMGALKSTGGSSSQLDVDLINPINALTLAREKGIGIEISERDQGLTSHTNLLTCEFLTENGALHLGGTVYARDKYRLIEFAGYDVDAELTGQVLVIENENVPGIIGDAGSILARHQINISHVSSGLSESRDMAVNIFGVDGEFRDELHRELAEIPHVRKIHLLHIS